MRARCVECGLTASPAETAMALRNEALGYPPVCACGSRKFEMTTDEPSGAMMNRPAEPPAVPEYEME